MKLGDFIWILILSIIILYIVLGEQSQFLITHNMTFKYLTKTYPYPMGFCKVAILASMGELLAMRIAKGTWQKPKGMTLRFLVWGIIGFCFVFAFPLFSEGIKALITNGLLPDWQNNVFITALLTSTFMNLIFGPTFMGAHRLSDVYIDLADGKLANLFKVPFAKAIDSIDFKSFIGFVLFKTIPLFWIPAHTITFCLPPEYRVLCAAMLSIFLGLILAGAKLRAAKKAAAQQAN